jgi:hypothetical protein
VISIEDTREKITETILNLTGKSETALLTLFVYRQMDKIDWLPFVKAAVERNPVCFTELNGKSIAEAYNILDKMPDESIMMATGLSSDEVWNWKGVKKPFCLVTLSCKRILLHRS